MNITWRDIAFTLGSGLAADVRNAWSWLVPSPWKPLVCSKVGGIFLEGVDERVRWLETGTGLVEEIATSAEEFDSILRTNDPIVEEWFLPGLVEELHAAGKRPGRDQCYGFTILPVFQEGRYNVENMVVVPIREQLVGSAEVHRQLADLPDGARVRLKVVD